MRAIDEIRAAGQRIWFDDLHRNMLTEGGLVRMRDQSGVSGITANPTTYAKAISTSPAYDDAIRRAGRRAIEDPATVFWDLAVEDVSQAADVLRPAFDVSGGTDGMVSLELAPALGDDTAGSIASAIDLFGRLDRPNVMIKVPGTTAGVDAIEQLTARGVNVNVTLLFGLRQWEAVWDAYTRALERRMAAGQNLEVFSVASFFLSRIDDRVNERLPEPLRNRAALSYARLAHAAWTDKLGSPQWASLFAQGARPQLLLWASTSTKDPALAPTYYVERLLAPETICTMPEVTLGALAELETLNEPRLPSGTSDEARELVTAAAEQSIDLEQVAEELQRDGLKRFADSFDEIVSCVREKAERLAA